MNEFALSLLLLKVVLAVFRVSYMVAEERGLYDIFRKIRIKYGAETPPTNAHLRQEYDKSNLAAGLGCPHCISFWFSLVAAIFLSLGGASHDVLLNWLALAGAVTLILKAGN